MTNYGKGIRLLACFKFPEEHRTATTLLQRTRFCELGTDYYFYEGRGQVLRNPLGLDFFPHLQVMHDFFYFGGQ